MGCSAVCRQVGLLLWKNVLLQIRRPIGTLFEIIIPVYAIALILVFRHAIFKAEDRCFVTFPADQLTVPLLPYVLGYTSSPEQANEAAAVMNLVRARLPPSGVFYAATDQEDMESFLSGSNTSLPIGCFVGGAGIVFDELSGSNIAYTLRLRHEVGDGFTWFTRFTEPQFQSPGPRVTQNFYLSEGFLHLQNVVAGAIVDWKAGMMGKTTPKVSVSVRQFPFPAYKDDNFFTSINSFVPALLVLAFIYSFATFVKELVLEKETRIRESMLMMGLSQWVLWSTWYIKQFIFLFVIVVFMSVMLKFGGVFPNSDFILILVFFTLFLFTLISFGYLVSVWFDSSRVALLMGFSLWYINYTPYFFIEQRYDTLALATKVILCIFSNTGLGLGITVFARLESQGTGLKWSNVASPISLDDSFHMGYVYMMFILDAIVFYVLAWYINAVKPGRYGVPKPLYFFVLPSYWTGRPTISSKQRNANLLRVVETAHDKNAFEEEPSDLEVGISIRNITKIYDKSWLRFFRKKNENARRVAVDNLSLNMYQGQITALLGHNGAGKTTITSMLTGLYTPTAGDAIIGEYSILNNMDQIRHSLGICPQHNVLFDRLTVSEHLTFFTRLKGTVGARVREEVNSMLKDLMLEDKRKTPVRQLSGGMKRKLSVGIALVGGSEIVVLDEPTSGMDPYARRATWDLLTKHKEGRTMLLTTHFMDEADLLGDRIAIMAEGKLKCSGSSLFLKGRYGIGYHMTLVKEPSCDSAAVTQLVQSHVRGAEQMTDVGAELSYVLPSTASTHFPQLFDALETQKGELGVSSFGVSVTTMEEVFIKVGEGSDEALEQRRLKHSSSLSHGSHSLPRSPLRVKPHSQAILEEVRLSGLEEEEVELEPSLDEDSADTGLVRLSDPLEPAETMELHRHRGKGDQIRQLPVYVPNSGFSLWLQQFRAMLMKRAYDSIRFYSALITRFLLPLVFISISIALAKNSTAVGDDPRRALRVDNNILSSNATLFWADFGDQYTSAPFSLSNITAESLNASDFFDFTGDVRSIMNSVQNFTDDPVQCCGYQNQILDKFCASQNMTELSMTCNDNVTFGYHTCQDTCLSCCGARDSSLPSCSDPFNQLLSPTAATFCPSPPLISNMDTDLTGRVDGENPFVAEQLLRVAKDLRTDVFFQRYMAGFSIAYRDAPFSVCGCSSRDVTCTEYLDPLLTYSFSDTGCVAPEIGNCPNETDSRASIVRTCVGSLASSCNLTSLYGTCQFSTSPPLNATECAAADPLPGNYSIDGLCGDFLTVLSCNAMASQFSNCGTFSERPISASFPQQDTEVSATVWYNNEPYHMSAASLNAFHNIWLQKVTGNPDLTITAYNHPLPQNITAEVEGLRQSFDLNFTGYSIGTTVVFGYSFLIASFVIFIVKEKETKAKHLQFASGLRVTSYWLPTFAWDLMTAFISVVVSTILFAITRVDAYKGDGLAAVFMLLVFTCWSSIPLVYCLSFLFSNSLTAFSIISALYIFSSFVPQLIVLLLTLFSYSQSVINTLHYIFLLLPSYGAGIGLNDIFTNSFAREVCTRDEVTMAFCNRPGSIAVYADSTFDISRPGIGAILLYMTAEGFIFFLLAMAIESSFFVPKLKGLFRHNTKRRSTSRASGLLQFGGEEEEEEDDDDIEMNSEPLIHGQDSDVYAEQLKVMHGRTTDDDVIIIKSLRKVYRRKLDGFSLRPAKVAVQGINLAIPSGECFGLLGVNGAGKTTVFRMLTGDLSITSGTAVVANFDIKTGVRDIQKRIGYCPQFDALIDRLTGRELLYMFARLRGIPERHIEEVVATEIERLDLGKHAKKRCATYSGGNKRKLSTAIALVGNPPIVFLDEPTTGMDPNTRRYLWDVLTGVIHEGRSIILTSHSMEECEALCTRLAIMVNGSFKCLGSIQHLKNKYGSGLTLQAKVKLASPPESPASHQGASKKSFFHRQSRNQPSQSSQSSAVDISLGGGGTTVGNNPFDSTALHIFIKETFPGSTLLEEHQGTVTYQLPSTDMTWSSVFHKLETNKERVGIVDYSVSQATLDQVFINFAKEQEETEL